MHGCSSLTMTDELCKKHFGVQVEAGTRTRRPSAEDVGFFEGAEKLLEVWFAFDASSPGLKLINRWVDQ